jgi:hypothetical protein
MAKPKDLDNAPRMLALLTKVVSRIFFENLSRRIAHSHKLLAIEFPANYTDIAPAKLQPLFARISTGSTDPPWQIRIYFIGLSRSITPRE